MKLNRDWKHVTFKFSFKLKTQEDIMHFIVIFINL